MPRRVGFVDVGGAQIFYETVGSGPPVVFVHGFSLDRRMWNDQVEPFSEKHQVIRYDVRGFGQSSPIGSATYSSVDDLKGLLDFFNLPAATIIGLSMGGGIAASFAVAHPKAIRALVVVDSNLWGYDFPLGFGESYRQVVQTASEAGVEAARSRWLAHPLFAPALERPKVGELLRQMVANYSGWHWLNRDPERGLNPPTRERLAEIHVPTLVVVGEQDLPDFQRIADILTQNIPGARQFRLPGAGHMSSMEAPRQFNEAVLEFLAEAARFLASLVD